MLFLACKMDKLALLLYVSGEHLRLLFKLLDEEELDEDEDDDEEEEDDDDEDEEELGVRLLNVEGKNC